jgi:hypothetical protein
LVRLSVEGFSLLVGVFYKAPSVQFLSFLNASDCMVSSVVDLSEIVFMGDFNLDLVNSAGNFRLLMSQCTPSICPWSNLALPGLLLLLLLRWIVLL